MNIQPDHCLQQRKGENDSRRSSMILRRSEHRQMGPPPFRQQVDSYKFESGTTPISMYTVFT